jgi:hypothetical protein
MALSIMSDQGGEGPWRLRGRKPSQAARWAQIRAAVAFFAAAGVAVLCLSYRDLEANNSAPRPKGGGFFASLAPEDNTLDSPDGQRGFQLLQKAAAASLLQHMRPAKKQALELKQAIELAQHLGPAKKQALALALTPLGSGAVKDFMEGAVQPVVGAVAPKEQELASDGLKFRARKRQVDFLSAGAARDEMQHYWQSLARRTKLENGGLQDFADTRAAKVDAAPHAGHGPLSADEARRQLDEYWNDLGAGDADKGARESLIKMRASARLAKKNAAIKDPKKVSSMNEMERIWSSESKSRKSASSEANSKKVHEVVSLHTSVQASSSVSRTEPGSKAARYTSLPMCDHCSLQHFTWPVWNRRVDHALRVAENIAQGSQWNKTLHHVTLGDDLETSSADGAGHDDDDVAASVSDADLKLEVENAMSSLRAAIAESKAEQVEEEADEHGEESASLSAAKRTECLSLCFSEVQSLVGFLTPHPHAAAVEPSSKVPSAAAASVEAATAAAAPVRPTRQYLIGDVKVVPVPKAAAASGDKGHASDGSSIEKAVDAVEAAVGGSEASAGKSGGGGLAAAVGGLAAAVSADHPLVSDVAPKHAAGASIEKAVDAVEAALGDPAAAHALAAHGGEHLAAVAQASGIKAAAASAAAHPPLPMAAAAAAAAAEVGNGVGADDETKNVRHLEDDALTSAAQAQEQVRQGEAELQHLKVLLSQAHKLSTERGGGVQGATSGGSDSGAHVKNVPKADGEERDDEADEDDESGAGINTGLSSGAHQALDLKSTGVRKGISGMGMGMGMGMGKGKGKRAVRPTPVRASSIDKYELADQDLIRSL